MVPVRKILILRRIGHRTFGHGFQYEEIELLLASPPQDPGGHSDNHEVSLRPR